MYRSVYLILFSLFCAIAAGNLHHKPLSTVAQIREAQQAASRFRSSTPHHVAGHPVHHLAAQFPHNPVTGRRAAPRTGGILSHAVDALSRAQKLGK